MHKVKEHEAYLPLLDIIPNNFTISHITRHQDHLTNYKDLIIPERLKIETDKITTCQAKPPINTSLPSTPFAIHVKGKYIYINFQLEKVVTKTARDNSCNLNTIWIHNKNIDWMIYSSCYTSFFTNKNRNIARCIHH